jgi:hypothetical protein
LRCVPSATLGQSPNPAEPGHYSDCRMRLRSARMMLSRLRIPDRRVRSCPPLETRLFHLARNRRKSPVRIALCPILLFHSNYGSSRPMTKFVRKPPQGLEDAVLVAGGEVDEYRISLGFYGDDLNPSELSTLLGRSATSSCLKGDIVHKDGRTRTERTGRWLLSVAPKPGEPLEPQLEDLFSSLTPDLAVWTSLTSLFRARFVVSAWIRSWNRGIEIEPRLLQEIAKRQLNLGIDIYVDYDEHAVQ